MGRTTVPQPSTVPLSVVRYTDTGKQVPVGNGGVGPGYWWTQTLGEVTVFIDVPGTTRARDVSVGVHSDRVVVRVAGALAPLLEGPLGGDVKPHEALWTLDSEAAGGTSPALLQRPADPSLPGGLGLPPPQRQPLDAGAGAGGGWKLLTLVLEKVTPTWWRSVVRAAGHPEIDATGVDSTQRVGEYDPETQAAIRRVMHDQAARAAGRPTSEEEALSKLVAAASVQPGSPLPPTPPPA